ncbi:MAG: LemA family protein [Pseudomonadota bacterium]
MVSIEDRLNRMVDNGVLSQEQAETMRGSINTTAQLKQAAAHRPLPIKQIIIGGIIALIAIWLFSFSGGNNTAEIESVQNVAETMNQVQGAGEMNKSLQTAISATVIMVPVLICLFVFMFLYNNIVSKEEEVFASWSQVETTYQRRADLIPNLVNTVKGYAEQEKEVLTEVTESRAQLSEALDNLQDTKAKAGRLSKDAASRLDDEDHMRELAATQKQLRQGMLNIFAVAESYPDLKSSDNFLTLQDQLESTENRINISRMMFNDAVRDFNKSIRVMPGSLIAGIGNFKRKAYYEADENTENATSVEF